MNHLTTEQLEAGLPEIQAAPKEQGVLAMIVRRPEIDQREVLTEGQLDLAEGLIGDNWKTRGSSKTPDGSAHPDKQLNVMNARSIALLAQQRERWPLAGDQLYVDLDISKENLPTGTQLAIGEAIIEITEPPHNGCDKFMDRYGIDAVRFVNSPTGKQLRLRGFNARVVHPGTIREGDIVRKL